MKAKTQKLETQLLSTTTPFQRLVFFFHYTEVSVEKSY